MADVAGLLPEFTRALRALGSRRGRRGARVTGAEQQARFFAPLVVARSAAASAHDAAGIVAAFDAATLRNGLNATLDGFASDRYPEYAPARRALEAEVSEVAEPLFSALERVQAAQARVPAAEPDAVALAAWSGAVQQLFKAADRVWVLLDDVLERAAMTDLAPPPASSRRGLRRRNAR